MELSKVGLPFPAAAAIALAQHRARNGWAGSLSKQSRGDLEFDPR